MNNYLGVCQRFSLPQHEKLNQRFIFVTRYTTPYLEIDKSLCYVNFHHQIVDNKIKIHIKEKRGLIFNKKKKH